VLLPGSTEVVHVHLPLLSLDRAKRWQSYMKSPWAMVELMTESADQWKLQANLRSCLPSYGLSLSLPSSRQWACH
jgi:hypothetical protein